MSTTHLLNGEGAVVCGATSDQTTSDPALASCGECWLRAGAEKMGVTALRGLAVGMPYKAECSKSEVIDWLVKYKPDALSV